MNKLQKIKEVLTFLSAPYNSGIYSGFTGQLNLGDEVLEKAIYEAFKPFKLVNPPSFQNNLIEAIGKSKSYSLSILGGGTLIGADISPGFNPFRDKFESMQKRSNFSVVYGTGVGKLSEISEQNEWLLEWKNLLKKCDYIGVRGPQSLETLASVGIEAEILGDPACLVTPDEGFWEPEARKLGVNLGFSLRAGNDSSEFKMIEEVKKLITKKNQEGWKIEFFVVCPQDVPVVEKVIKEINLSNQKVHYIFDDATPYLNAARSLTAFIGVKLHSVILAMCAGVPSIMIEYRPKCRDFMMSVDMENFSINIDEVTEEKLESCLNTLLSSSQETALKMTKRMIQLREKQLQKAAEITALIA